MRTVILALISFFLSMVVLLLWVLYLFIGNSKLQGLVLQYFYLFNGFFNFFCFSLTFHTFDCQYRCFCGCIDSKLKRWLFNFQERRPINIKRTVYTKVNDI